MDGTGKKAERTEWPVAGIIDVCVVDTRDRRKRRCLPDVLLPVIK